MHPSELDVQALIPLNARRVLEVGKTTGRFTGSYRQRNSLASITLICIDSRDSAADLSLSTAICDDSDKSTAGRAYDALILDDVISQVYQPEQLLHRLRMKMTERSVCVACVSNASHWSVVEELLKGRIKGADPRGVPLHPFTLESLVDLFVRAGWSVIDARQRILWPEKTQAAIQAFLPLAESLGIAPDNLQRDLSAFQWIIRAVNGPPPSRVHVVGLGLKKMAGVTEARVDHPLAALNTLADAAAVWASGTITIPRHFQPGILMLHRQFLSDPAFNTHVESMIAKGWVVVSDMDDDPHHWRAFAEADFRAYRGVHAITVSTEPLAAIIRQWNPHVRVFPNAIYELPEPAADACARRETFRVFFGALNRAQDWAMIQEGVIAAARTLGSAMELVIVHDRAVHDSLPDWVNRQFHPTLAPAQYMQLLASCDAALLPLRDTPFNRLKSDLKFIESCAAGAVPICSPVVYAEEPRHREIGVFAATPEDWERALLELHGKPDDLARRRSAGLSYVKHERMHAHQATQRRAYYAELLANRTSLEAERQQRLNTSILTK